MTDRELLEAAAKAAGIEIWWTDNYGGVFLRRRNCPVIWRPLTDDGHAFRLAVKLGLHVSQQLSYVAVMRPHGGAGSHLLQWTEQYNDDPCAATRRAIVRAAAYIGSKT